MTAPDFDNPETAATAPRLNHSNPEFSQQLSGENRVTTGMSSVAMDGGGILANGEQQRATGAVRLTRTNTPDALAGLTDAEVMLRVKAGDDDAFNFLIEKFRRPLISFMYRMTHNSATAEELAQEVFLRMYRSRAGYTANAKLTTWMYRIATNLAVNHARDTKHERPENVVSIDESDEDTGLTVDVPDTSLNVEQNMLRRERLAAIRQHVQDLPERQRTAVLMHKYQNMDYKQIAEVLNLSESATKSLLFRAYETLRDKLKDFI
jgi:RNA polymerase sigma-70 factor (ECF subfamily)